MWTRLTGALLAAGLLISACGSDDGDAAGSAVATAATGDAAPADLRLGSSALGDILVDADGNAVYLFVPDAQGDSTCYDQCETAWPVVGELASVGDGLDAGLLGTTTRNDGATQATYNGWPLYYFAKDAEAGDVNGQGVNDVWYVLGAKGDAVEDG